MAESDRRRQLLPDYLRVQLKYGLLVRLLGRKITQERVLGFDFRFSHYKYFATVFNEIFLPQVYRFTPRRPDPLIFDCGAHIGMAVHYFKWMYPDCRIVAFEPDPATFELLKSNVERNRLKDVELRCEAIGGAPGTAPFYHVEASPGWLAQSMVKPMGSGATAVMVPVVTLSPLIHEEIDLLKMDTEGAEAAAFAELETSGKLGSIRATVLEYHHHMTPGEDFMGTFLSLLERNGFGYMITSLTRTPFVPGEFSCFMVGAYRMENGKVPARF